MTDNVREYQADAWDEGWFAAREFYVKAVAPEGGIESNPYRTTEQIARIVLEAAAPNQLGSAWEAGYEGGKSDEFARSKGFTGYHANPYRPTR